MSEPERLGDILPAVMRDIEARMQNAQLQSNCTDESVVSQLKAPQMPVESISPGSLRSVETAGENPNPLAL